MKFNKIKIFSLAMACLMIQGTTNAYAASKKSETYTKEELNNLTPGFSVADKTKSQYKVDSYRNTYSSTTPPTDDDEEEEEIAYNFDQITASQGSQVQSVINTPRSYGNTWAKTTDGQWMYLESGVPTTGWKYVSGNWYYMSDTGIMQTGWLNYGGTWYYLYESGAMAHSTYADGYYLTSSGAMA